MSNAEDENGSVDDDAIEMTYEERVEERREFWLSRPVFTAERVIEAMWWRRRRLDAEPSYLSHARDRSTDDFFQNVESLGWSADRLENFAESLSRYRNAPNIENYISLRKNFPEVDIHVGRMEPGPHFGLHVNDYFAEVGIDEGILRDAFYIGDEPSADALCLNVLELIAERDAAPSSCPGAIERRRSSISDSSVDYLIVLLLENHLLGRHEWSRFPGALLALIRHRLCGPNPDLETAYISDVQKYFIAYNVAGRLNAGQKPSFNTLARLAGIPRSRAERLLKDPEFVEALQAFRKLSSAPDLPPI